MATALNMNYAQSQTIYGGTYYYPISQCSGMNGGTTVPQNPTSFSGYSNFMIAYGQGLAPIGTLEIEVDEIHSFEGEVHGKLEVDE